MHTNTGNNLPDIAAQFAMHFYTTVIRVPDIFCVVVFFHRSVGLQNLV